jgi:hypothetical protein
MKIAIKLLLGIVGASCIAVSVALSIHRSYRIDEHRREAENQRIEQAVRERLGAMTATELFKAYIRRSHAPRVAKFGGVPVLTCGSTAQTAPASVGNWLNTVEVESGDVLLRQFRYDGVKFTEAKP